MIRVTVNGTGLVAAPAGVVTVTLPERAPNGTVVAIEVSDSTENGASAVPNRTEVAPLNCAPTISTSCRPGRPTDPAPGSPAQPSAR